MTTFTSSRDDILVEVKRRLVARHLGLSDFEFVPNFRDLVIMFYGAKDGKDVGVVVCTDVEMRSAVMALESARLMADELTEKLSRWWVTGYEKPMARCVDDVGCDCLEEGRLYLVLKTEEKFLTVVLKDGDEQRLYRSRFEIEGGV